MSIPAYIGRYEIRHEVARGAFAAVYLGWDEELESPVAIKVLLPQLAEDEHTRLRFVEEARLLRRVSSPHVVTVHDIGRLNDGRPYLILDYADRGTLAPRLLGRSSGSTVDTQSILALADALAAGLAAIHDAGLVHRDIKPANILLTSRRYVLPTAGDPSEVAPGAALIDKDERALVGDLGIAKDMAREQDAPTLVGGTPLYLAPEQNDPRAQITVAADIYAASAVLLHCLTGRVPPNAGALETTLASLRSGWQDVLAQGMAWQPEKRFSDIEEWHGAVLEAAVQEAVTDARTLNGVTAVAADAVCPYKGLAAYQEEDADLFVGREGLIDELLRRLQVHSVLVVGGPSGSGKSSLLMAGVLPALRSGGIPNSEHWRLVAAHPGASPLRALCEALPELEPALNDGIERVTEAMHAAGDPQRPTLLFIDQFEEIFTLSPGEERETFLCLLAALTDPAESVFKLVIAVRADFYEACAKFPWLAKRITNNQVLVGPMSATDLRRAITEPARRVGLYLERELVDAITVDAGREAGSLPLVAHALMETWVRRKGKMLTLEDYRSVGGVAGAISQTADSLYEHEFSTEERAAAKKLLLQLVKPGEGVADTRRLINNNDIAASDRPEITNRVVDKLAHARLLTVTEDAIQIAHEALLRTWPRLRGWIEESRDDLRTRQKIERAANDWLAGGEDPDLLYRGTPLLSAQEWADRHAEYVGGLAQRFLARSAEARNRVRAEERARRRRAKRWTTTAIAALALLTIGATTASIVAFRALSDARTNEEIARVATMRAENRFASALGSAAYGQVGQNPRLALILAAEAMRRSQSFPSSYDTRAAMLEARNVLFGSGPFLLGSAIPAGDALRIALSPDGSRLASAQRDGSIWVFDTMADHAHPRILAGHAGGIRDLAFDESGRRLVSGSTDRTVRFWDLEAPIQRATTLVGEAEDVIMSVSMDPSANWVAAASGDGTARLWRLGESGLPGQILDSKPYEYDVIKFSPDGASLYGVYRDRTVTVWDVDTRKTTKEFLITGHTGHLLDVNFDPAGSHIATMASDGFSNIVDLLSGEITMAVFPKQTPTGGVVFGAEGKVLLGGGYDGRLRVVDVAQQRLIAESPVGHAQPIIHMVASANRKLIATLGRDQRIRIWTYGTVLPPATPYRVPGRKAKGVAMSPDARWLAAGDDEGRISIWNRQAAKAPMLLEGHAAAVWALDFSTDGDSLATADRNGNLRIWNTATGYLRRNIRVGDGSIWSVVFLQDASHVVVASDAAVSVWSVEDEKRVRNLGDVTGEVTRAVLSPDGSYLGVAHTDGRIRVWKVSDWTLHSEFTSGNDIAWSLGFSHDNRYVAVASANETVTVRSIDDGELQLRLAGHSGGTTDVGFLADGVTLVAVDRSGDLHWWDLATGRRLAEAWPAHKRSSWRLFVQADGYGFATSGDDGQVKVWDALSVERACEVGQLAFDEQRRRQYLGDGEQLLACRPG